MINFTEHLLTSAASRDRSSQQHIYNANQDVGAHVPYVSFTCAQSRLVGWTFFSHILDKYCVHWLQPTFLIPYMTENSKKTEDKMQSSGTEPNEL